VKFVVSAHQYFNASRNKTYLRQSKSETCSKKCSDYAKGTMNRMPKGHCTVDNCTYFGKLVKGFCSTHFQYFWRHGVATVAERTNRNPQILPISEGWKQWIAGIIDCEGWIGIMRSARKNGIAYCGRVGVGNTNSILTSKLIEITKIGCCKQHIRHAPAKNMWQWNVSKRKDVDDLLVTIRPYLLLKKEQADLLLSLPPLHTKDGTIRSIVQSRLAVLNRKGKH
jgi:hypothetical protein